MRFVLDISLANCSGVTSGVKLSRLMVCELSFAWKEVVDCIVEGVVAVCAHTKPGAVTNAQASANCSQRLRSIELAKTPLFTPASADHRPSVPYTPRRRQPEALRGGRYAAVAKT